MKCPRCQSQHYTKNGLQRGKQKYMCKVCGRQWLNPVSDRGYPKSVRRLCVRMYHNGLGAKAIQRYTGISHNTIMSWVKQAELWDHASSHPRTQTETSDADQDDEARSRFITLLGGNDNQVGELVLAS